MNVPALLRHHRFTFYTMLSMNDDRLLTVAIHTYGKALELKALLEHEGITVVLNNVNLSQPSISSGVRVRIKESDLPLALRIIENSEIFVLPDDNEANSLNQTILVPVDFSTYSLKASTIAFDIASRHNARIILLHAYVPPARLNLQLSATLDFGTEPNIEDNAEQEIIADKELHTIARKKIDEFSSKLRELIKQGELPPVKFSTQIIANVPEDAILDVSKKIKPYLIVMGTRGAEKKERELIGSVTAEVLDSCRQPVLTIPEQSNLKSVVDIKEIFLMANMDQNDMLALDAITRLAPHNAMNIHILHINNHRLRGVATQSECDMLLEYCRTHYPLCTFTIQSMDAKDGAEYLKQVTSPLDNTLIVVPNKKTNILARLFNPSLAHKLLFHADIPLMAVPV